MSAIAGRAGSQSLGLRSGVSVPLVHRSSTKCNWVRRAEAWGEHVDQNIQRKTIALRRKHAEWILLTAQTIGSKVVEGLALKVVEDDPWTGEKRLLVIRAWGFARA